MTLLDLVELILVKPTKLTLLNYDLVTFHYYEVERSQMLHWVCPDVRPTWERRWRRRQWRDQAAQARSVAVPRTAAAAGDDTNATI